MLSLEMPQSLLPSRWKLSPLLIAVGTLLAGITGRAQIADTFYNDTLYTSIANINATNFVNDSGGTFSVTPGLGNGWLSDLYWAWYNTRNFTNNGEMDSYTGFRFDTHIVNSSVF
jgi:hypothetical protein